MKPNILIISIAFLIIAACNKSPSEEIRDDFKKYYDQYQVEGSFVLYDQRNDKYIFYNKNQYNQGFSPASTFKICNTLIGLETGVIKDQNFVIPWDSVVRNPIWDKDHNLKTAFANSTVWYYQELARRIGGARMKYWLDKAKYGNADTSGGIDQFWLSGGLRISPHQQIEFLKQLQSNSLPFSKRSIAILKEIMITQNTKNYTIRSKTGWGIYGNKDAGWDVGYLETKGNVFYFVNCIQVDSKALTDTNRSINFGKSRVEIVDSILYTLGLTRE